jgi:glycosyltransferase involved in cell wall biosynthesis
VTKQIYVVLATYHGERFLGEQLDSLLAQRYPLWRLLLRDDGSRDATAEVAARYAARDPRIRLLPPSTRNEGPASNFADLLQAAYAEGAEYVLLMDQDDIWLPDKIGEELSAMRAAEIRQGSGIPILVHSDLALVDRDGRLLGTSFMRYQRIRNESAEPLRTLLVLNYVTGCTVLVNRPLLAVALPIPSQAMMHDWWLALIAAASGSIVYLPQATVYYRQHGANQIGAKGIRKGFASVFSVIRFSGTHDSQFARTVRQAGLLEWRLRERGIFQPDNGQHQLLMAFSGLFAQRLPWYRRLLGIRQLRLRRQWFLRQWLLYLYAALARAAP